MNAVEIIAHRGASDEAPENTLAAMKLAWKYGADAIELDIQLTKDGKVIVYHDADTKRYDGTERKVADLTWEELQKLDVGSWKSLACKGERIPALASVLETMPQSKRTVIEIKCGPEILPELKRILDESGRTPEELTIISFGIDTLRESKLMFPRIPHYFLI